MQIRDKKVPFSFSWIHKVLSSICFTMFRLEQPDIKISKSFQIKTICVCPWLVREYPNWYMKLKTCPFMDITDWILVYSLSACARGTAKYMYDMYGQCTLYRAVWVAYFVAKISLYLNEFGYFIFQLPFRWNIVKQNDINILCFMKKNRERFCLE